MFIVTEYAALKAQIIFISKRLLRLGLDEKKNKTPDFVACESQRRRPACTSAQSGQRLYHTLCGKSSSQTCCMHNFNILASRCS